MDRLKIGIIAKRLEDERLGEVTYIRETAKQACYDLGALPVGIVPPEDRRAPLRNDNAAEAPTALTEVEQEALLAAMSPCDGFLLQGGYYVDLYEAWVARYCYDHDLPILGICAGHQVMAHALGGKIDKSDPETTHAVGAGYAHPVSVAPDSQLFALTGKTSFLVNSSHKYVVTDPGPLRISAIAPRLIAEPMRQQPEDEDFDFGLPEAPATAPDDNFVIEGLEAPDKRFYVAVQFHPENLYREDPVMLKIFEGFLAACRASREARGGEDE